MTSCWSIVLSIVLVPIFVSGGFAIDMAILDNGLNLDRWGATGFLLLGVVVSSLVGCWFPWVGWSKSPHNPKNQV